MMLMCGSTPLVVPEKCSSCQRRLVGSGSCYGRRRRREAKVLCSDCRLKLERPLEGLICELTVRPANFVRWLTNPRVIAETGPGLDPPTGPPPMSESHVYEWKRLDECPTEGLYDDLHTELSIADDSTQPTVAAGVVCTDAGEFYLWRVKWFNFRAACGGRYRQLLSVIGHVRALMVIHGAGLRLREMHPVVGEILPVFLTSATESGEGGRSQQTDVFEWGSAEVTQAMRRHFAWLAPIVDEATDGNPATRASAGRLYASIMRQTHLNYSLMGRGSQASEMLTGVLNNPMLRPWLFGGQPLGGHFMGACYLTQVDGGQRRRPPAAAIPATFNPLVRYVRYPIAARMWPVDPPVSMPEIVDVLGEFWKVVRSNEAGESTPGPCDVWHRTVMVVACELMSRVDCRYLHPGLTAVDPITAFVRIVSRLVRRIVRERVLRGFRVTRCPAHGKLEPLWELEGVRMYRAAYKPGPETTTIVQQFDLTKTHSTANKNRYAAAGDDRVFMGSLHDRLYFGEDLDL